MRDLVVLEDAGGRRPSRRRSKAEWPLGRHWLFTREVSMGIWDVLNKLEAEEQAFVARQVLAPVLAGRAVAVRIAGIVCTLRVEGADDVADADDAAGGASGGHS